MGHLQRHSIDDWSHESNIFDTLNIEREPSIARVTTLCDRLLFVWH